MFRFQATTGSEISALVSQFAFSAAVLAPTTCALIIGCGAGCTWRIGFAEVDGKCLVAEVVEVIASSVRITPPVP